MHNVADTNADADTNDDAADNADANADHVDDTDVNADTDANASNGTSKIISNFLVQCKRNTCASHHCGENTFELFTMTPSRSNIRKSSCVCVQLIDRCIYKTTHAGCCCATQLSNCTQRVKSNSNNASTCASCCCSRQIIAGCKGMCVQWQ